MVSLWTLRSSERKVLSHCAREKQWFRGSGCVSGGRALLVPQFGARAYGMVFALTEREIEALYAEPDLELYRRESVIASFEDRTFGAVTTFNLGATHANSEVNREYAAKLQVVFEQLGFPTDAVQFTH